MSASQTITRSPEAADDYRAEGRAQATVAERVLRLARRAFRRPEPHWLDLNDHLLADIGETRAHAESARGVWRSLHGVAGGAVGVGWRGSA
jgi:hypothetical protein